VVRYQNKTLQPLRRERNKKVAEGEPFVGVVEVADPVQVRLAIRVIPPDIARVAVTLEGYVRNTFHATTLRILSGLYRIRHHNALVFRTKYLHFLLKCLHTPLYPKPWSEVFSMYGYWIR
jgi:hypothetical protein